MGSICYDSFPRSIVLLRVNLLRIHCSNGSSFEIVLPLQVSFEFSAIHHLSNLDLTDLTWQLVAIEIFSTGPPRQRLTARHPRKFKT